MDVLAVSYRILDAAEETLLSMSGTLEAELAALVGVAAKFVQHADVASDHVMRLWTAIAGKTSVQAIRNIEPRVSKEWLWAMPCSGKNSLAQVA